MYHARCNQKWGTCALVCSAVFSENVMSYYRPRAVICADMSLEGLSVEVLVRDGKCQNFPSKFQQGLYKSFVKYVLTGNIRLHH